MTRIYSFMAASLSVLALAACGGDEAAPVLQPPVVVATPTPSPTPTPAPTPGSSTVLLGGAKVGDVLSSVLVCRDGGDITFDAQGRISGYASFAGRTNVADPKNFLLNIRVNAVDQFSWDFNGWGGVTYGPDPRQAGDHFVRFWVANRAVGEMQIARDNNQLEFGTYGMLAEDYGDEDSLCFVAAAPNPGTPFPGFGQTGYLGSIDGYRRTPAGEDWRLFNHAGVRGASLQHKGGNNYELVLNIAGVPDLFANPEGQTIQTFFPIGVPLTRNGAGFEPFDDMVFDYRVRVEAFLWGEGYLSALVAFSITEPDGSETIGVAAMDGNQI